MPARIIITPEQDAYIRQHCRTQFCYDIAAALGLSNGVVSRYMEAECLKMSRSMHCKLRALARVGYTSYTPEEDAYIRAHYLDTPIKRIATQLGRSNCGVLGRLQAMGLTLPKEVAMRSAVESRFKKGQISHNKGKAMSPEMRQRLQHTFYKPGNLPANTRKDGDISIRTDKRGVKYKFIRIGLARWEALARYNYRKEFGPIPHGHVIIHRDGDTLNCDPTNLKMITKAENMIRNSIHNYPAEIVNTVHTLSTLKRHINHAAKQA